MPKAHANAFVETLTSEERATLDDFKARFADVDYTDKTDPDSWFKLDDDRVLLKFLRARDFDVNKAEKLLRDCVAFRDKYEAHKVNVTDEDVREALHMNGGVWRPAGYTKNGHMIQLIQIERFHAKDVKDEHTYTRTLIAENEYLARAMAKEKRVNPETGRPIETAVVLFDMKGYSLFDQGGPTGLKWTKILIDVTQNCYVESLEKAILFNAPWLFRTAWKIISPWLDEHTAARVLFVTDPKELHSYIDPDQLYEAYGGTKKDEYPLPC